ncbi:MAG TPA: phage holin family protein [Dissulfurispiraceae bacterium]|nr:phage holin family protein [Dissulfurispiraceae bacterium]
MPLVLLQIMINALSIAAAVKLVDGIVFTGEWWKMIIIGALFGIVNSLIKPFVQLITFPLIILTLGIFTLVVNTMMLGLTEWLSKPLALGLEIHGFWPTFWGALIVSIVSMLLSAVTGLRRTRE